MLCDSATATRVRHLGAKRRRLPRPAGNQGPPRDRHHRAWQLSAVLLAGPGRCYDHRYPVQGPKDSQTVPVLCSLPTSMCWPTAQPVGETDIPHKTAGTQVPGDQLKAVEASSDLHANSCHLSLLGETFRRLCRQAPTLPDRGPLSRCLLCLTQLTGTQQRFMPQLQQQCTRQQCQAASIIKH